METDKLFKQFLIAKKQQQQQIDQQYRPMLVNSQTVLEIAAGHHCGEDIYEHVLSHCGSKHVQKYLLHSDDQLLFPPLGTSTLLSESETKNELVLISSFKAQNRTYMKTSYYIIFSETFPFYMKCTKNTYIRLYMIIQESWFYQFRLKKKIQLFSLIF